MPNLVVNSWMSATWEKMQWQAERVPEVPCFLHVRIWEHVWAVDDSNELKNFEFRKDVLGGFQAITNSMKHMSGTSNAAQQHFQEIVASRAKCIASTRHLS